MNTKKIERVIKSVSTPCYIYDLKTIKSSYLDLRKNIPPNIEIFYAVKANPNKNIVSFFNRLGAGADVASGGELGIALRAGMKPDRISFAGPGKTAEELTLAIQKNVGSISAESIGEVDLIAAVARKNKKTANVSVRINPASESLYAALKMGGGSQQFGVDEETAPKLIRVISKERSLRLTGIHMHACSQVLSEETVASNIKYLLEYGKKIQRQVGISIQRINFGGGLGIPYYKGQEKLNIKRLGKLINKIFDEIGVRKHFRNTRFFIEPGRFLVGEAGIYVTKVLYKKRSRGKTFLIVDGGMHQNLAAAGLLGESIRRNRLIEVATKARTLKKETVTIAGCLCTPLDILARDIALPVCGPGDHIIIPCSGAYGYSASPLNFLSHPAPKEIVA